MEHPEDARRLGVYPDDEDYVTAGDFCAGDEGDRSSEPGLLNSELQRVWAADKISEEPGGGREPQQVGALHHQDQLICLPYLISYLYCISLLDSFNCDQT